MKVTGQNYLVSSSSTPRVSTKSPSGANDLVTLNTSNDPIPPKPPANWAHRAVAGGYTAATWAKTAGVLCMHAAGSGSAIAGIASWMLGTPGDAASLLALKVLVGFTASAVAVTAVGAVTGLVRGNASEARDNFRDLQKAERDSKLAQLKAQEAAIQNEYGNLR